MRRQECVKSKPTEPDGQGSQRAVLNEGKSKQTNITRARRTCRPIRENSQKYAPESVATSISNVNEVNPRVQDLKHGRYCPEAPKNKSLRSRSLVLGAGTPATVSRGRCTPWLASARLTNIHLHHGSQVLTNLAQATKPSSQV